MVALPVDMNDTAEMKAFQKKVSVFSLFYNGI